MDYTWDRKMGGGGGGGGEMYKEGSPILGKNYIVALEAQDKYHKLA